MAPRYIPLPVRQRKRYRWMWRVLPALIAVILALTAFQLGVEVDGRAGMPQAGILAQLYAICTLFVLGGLDLGLPSGSTEGARGLMWVAYFLAPAVTTVAVIEAFLESLQPGWWQRRRLKDHLLVVGGGRMGTLYLEALRAEEPDAQALLVDTNPSCEAVANHFGAVFLQGDVRREATRRQLSLEKARGVIVTTKDDLLNLGTAASIADAAPNLKGKITVHVGDLGLTRTLRHPQRSDGSTSPSTIGHERLFNSHQVAAQHLVEHKLRTHFALTKATDVVVLGGFGRFNQTILEVLQSRAAGEFHAVTIVDTHAEHQARSYAEQVGFGALRVDIVEGDMNDPQVWEQVHEACAEVASPAYVLGTDADSVNLRVALGLRRRYPEARIFVRCFDESSFSQRLAADAGFEVSSVAALVRESLRVHHRQWFDKR
jgi:hypothetical protein